MKRILLLILTVAIIGCSPDELDRSIFIPDPDDPELPAYSEWGYNTFGAYYDRDVITSNNIDTPAKAYNENATFSFLLSGNRGGYSYYSSSANATTIKFTLLDFHPASYSDLVTLNSSSFDLTSPSVKVTISIDGVDKTITVISGQLQFKRAQSLLIDQTLQQVILSGYFDMKLTIGNTPVNISKGRFDVGISNNNFFKY